MGKGEERRYCRYQRRVSKEGVEEVKLKTLRPPSTLVEYLAAISVLVDIVESQIWGRMILPYDCCRIGNASLADREL
jgi:hypothetical protein